MASDSRRDQTSGSRSGMHSGRPHNRSDQGHRLGSPEENSADLQESSRHGDHRDESPSARGACANPDCETSVKLVDPEEPLADAPSLSREPSIDSSNMHSIGRLADNANNSHRNYSTASTFRPVPYVERHAVPVPAPSIGDTALDVSLHSRPDSGLNYSSGDSGRLTLSNNSSTPANSLVSVQAPGVNRGNVLMNIPPDEARINNTEIPVGMAERQPFSFRSTTTEASPLPSYHNSVEQIALQQSQLQQFQLVQPQDQQRQQQDQQRQQQDQQRQQQERQEQLQLCLPNQALCYIGPSRSSQHAYMSNEDNTQNISVSILPNGRLMTAQPFPQAANTPGVPQGNAGRSNGPVGAGVGGASAGRQMSHSSSMSSMKSYIEDNRLVRKLPRKALKLVADHLHCRCSSGTWKELVEMYDWDYDKTLLFENQYHQEGPFFSLLREPEFQDYTLEQLRHDLFELPRRDILSELNELITTHNSSASNRPEYGSGNPAR